MLTKEYHSSVIKEILVSKEFTKMCSKTRENLKVKSDTVCYLAKLEQPFTDYTLLLQSWQLYIETPPPFSMDTTTCYSR